jgi:hypothetical protein
MPIACKDCLFNDCPFMAVIISFFTNVVNGSLERRVCFLNLIPFTTISSTSLLILKPRRPLCCTLCFRTPSALLRLPSGDEIIARRTADEATAGGGELGKGALYNLLPADPV